MAVLQILSKDSELTSSPLCMQEFHELNHNHTPYHWSKQHKQNPLLASQNESSSHMVVVVTGVEYSEERSNESFALMPTIFQKTNMPKSGSL